MFRFKLLWLSLLLLWCQLVVGDSSLRELRRGMEILGRAAYRYRRDSLQLQLRDGDTQVLPPILPISVTAQRLRNNTALVTFTVQHSGPGTVAMPVNVIGSSDEPSQPLAAPPDGSSTTSTVQFNIGLDWCPSPTERRDMFDLPFTFSGVGETPTDLALVMLNLCFFDVNRHYIERLMGRESLEGLQPFSFAPMSEEIVFPRVFLDDEERVKSYDLGENVMIRFGIDPSQERGTYYFVSLLFYDSQNDEVAGSEYFIQNYGGTFDINRAMTFGQFEGIDQLNQTGNTDTRADFELSLETASGRYSGVVHILAYLYTSVTPTRLPTAGTAAFDAQITVKKQGQSEALPRNKFMFRQLDRIECGPGGNALINTGPSCSVPCFVNGRGVVSLQITPPEPNSELASSHDQIFESYAQAFLDLGPARPSINGTYVCSVTGSDGVVVNHNIDVIVSEHH